MVVQLFDQNIQHDLPLHPSLISKDAVENPRVGSAERRQDKRERERETERETTEKTHPFLRDRPRSQVAQRAHFEQFGFPEGLVAPHEEDDGAQEALFREEGLERGGQAEEGFAA